MSPRARLPIPFGQGLDRLTGSAEVDPRSSSRLENVHLYQGRMEFRRGLQRKLLAAWGTHIVGLFGVQAQGLVAAVIYDSVSRNVRLYLVDSTFAAPTLAGTMWTMPAGAVTPPVVVGANAYQKLVLAHDEAIFANRQTTKVLDASSLNLTSLQGDLNRSGTPHDVKFRGVVAHLNYVLGWGYGDFADEDRPEYLRVSDPGLPTAFGADHYFQVGAKGDPIIGCARAGAVLRVAKLTEAYPFVGTARQNFDIGPVMDEHFGQLASRLAVTVNGENFHWTLQGPRVSTGGPSQDLAPPLDLANDAHDPAVSGATRMFAFYDPTEGEVGFVFDDWGYILHLRDTPRRWSTRPYATPVQCAGLVYEGGASVPIVVYPDWTDRGALLNADTHAVAWSPTLGSGSGRLVTATGGGNNCKYSDDGGLTWTACTISNHNWKDICWSVAAVKFVIVGNDAGVGVVASSADGITFTDRTPATASAWQGVVDCPAPVSKIVAVGYASGTPAGDIMTSTDGITWTTRAAPAGDNNYEGVAFDGTQVVATGVNVAARSTDGVTWAAAGTQPVGDAARVRYAGGAIARFVAMGGGISGFLATSPTGAVWTTQTLPASTPVLGDAVFASSLLTVLALVNAGDVTKGSLASSNGTAFLARTVAYAENWRGVVYVIPLSRYVAVGENGRVMTA